MELNHSIIFISFIESNLCTEAFFNSRPTLGTDEILALVFWIDWECRYNLWKFNQHWCVQLLVEHG